MTATTTDLDTCTWLVQVPTASLYPPEAEWYPDSPEDVYTIMDCGQPANIAGLCSYHQAAMDLPDDEFERISDLHDGRAWS